MAKSPQEMARTMLANVPEKTGRPTTSGRFTLWMMGLMAPFAPQRSKTEHWP
ncbi:MAG: hypothetical protein AB8G16_17645 [Gammaproteobacteria bacterium]